jgi:hypothetical protein
MIEAKPLLEHELVPVRRGARFSQSLLELLVPFALCAFVVGGVWYFLQT